MYMKKQSTGMMIAAMISLCLSDLSAIILVTSDFSEPTFTAAEIEDGLAKFFF